MAVCVPAQQVSYRHYTPDNGLPSSEVYFVHQDREGYIWFATDRGMSRYNGYTFETFTTQNGLPDNVAFAIAEDNQGTLWFNSLSKGLFCYSKDSGFYSAPYNDQVLTITKSNGWIKKLNFDNNNRIWLNLSIPTPEHQFYYIDLQKGIREEQNVEKLQSNETLIKILNNNNAIYTSWLWSEASDNTVLVTTAKKGYYKITCKKLIDDCIVLANNKIIVAVGRQLVFIEHGKIEKTIDLPGDCVTIYRHGNEIWIATRGGACLVKDEKMVATYLPGITITNVLADNEGNYWFTTLDQGVYMAPSLDFNNMPAITEKVSGLFSDNEKLYGLTYSHKMFLVDKQNNFVLTKLPHTIIELRPGKVSQAPAKIIGGFLVLEKNKKLICANATSKAKNILPINHGWVVGCIDGFYIALNNGYKIASAQLNFNYRVNATCIDSSQKIWLGTLFGLYTYKMGETGVKKIAGLSYRINALTTYNNVVIAGTAGNGLFFISGNKKINITEAQQLAGDYITTLYLNKNILWVGTNKGFSCITLAADGAVTNIESYTQHDGLISNEVNTITFFNNYLWIGTNKGLTYINPAKLKPKKNIEMPVYIKSVQVNETAMPVISAGLNLGNNQRNLNISYSNIAFANPGSTKYYYKLEGLHNQWLQTTENNVKFVNLPPGDYVFKVAATNASTGLLPLHPSAIRIHIAGHFTQTWWFITLIVLAGIAAIWGAAFVYIKNHQKKLVIQRKLIVSEQQALRAQMNPHFIFNALNSVQYYITENDKRSAGIFLSKFSSLVRAILENSNHSAVSLEEELACIRKYLDLEQVRFGNKFSFEMQVEDGLPLSDIKIPSMLIQPLLENAIWHGLMPKEEPGRLVFLVKQEDGNVQCIIEDNGIGRQKAAQIERSRVPHKSSAIENIEKRIQLVKQLLGINIHLYIEDLFGNSGDAAGTKACLTIQIKK